MNKLDISSDELFALSQSPIRASRTRKGALVVIEEDPNQSLAEVTWDDRPTPIRNGSKRIVGRQKSSDHIKKVESNIKRHHSSPVLNAAEIARKAEEEKREFEEFARLLKGGQPRNLMNKINENLDDSRETLEKPKTSSSSKALVGSDDFDSFLDEDLLASLEAEAIKTLSSQQQQQSKTYSFNNISTSTNRRNSAGTSTGTKSNTSHNVINNEENDEDDDDIMMAIPLDLLSGENVSNKPINIDYKAITQQKTVENVPLNNNLKSMIPKKRTVSEAFSVSGNNEKQNLEPPAQRIATREEIEQKRQEALRRRQITLERQRLHQQQQQQQRGRK